MYGQNIRVIIVPSILALAYLGPSFYLDHSLADLDLLPLVMWLAADGALFTVQNVVYETRWGSILVLTSLITSMTVNALVTGLIVFRISKVSREVKSATTSMDKAVGITHGNQFHSVTFTIIESGMALLAAQLARVAIAISLSLTTTDSGSQLSAVVIIIAIHEMVNVIISSVIVTLCLLITSI